MKKRKGTRCLALLLCAALLVGMMGVLVLPASAAGGTCQHTMTTRTVTRTDCVYGSCETSITECTKCGFAYMTATRPAGAYAHGEHHFTTMTFPSETCTAHGAVVNVCSACQFTQLVTRGGHQWSDWETVSSGAGPCAVKTEQRACACGAVENRSSGGHDWKITYTDATCTEPGKRVQTCSVCGERSEAVTQPALNHLYQSGTLCTDERTCIRCGDVQPGVSHTLNYVDAGDGHYQTCSRCSYTTPVNKHFDSGDGCCVCGRQVGSGKCSHQWTIENKTSTFTHREKCALCGETKSVNCTQSTLYTPRTDCTTTEYCSCGNVRREPQKNHNFGTWRCTDCTHTHACLNSGCQYGQTPEPHTYQTVSGGLKKCVVCNYTDPKSLASHTHVWGVWTSGGGSSHSHACTVPGCSAVQSANHSFGAANCKGEAVCSDCGATVTGRPAGAHSGGTEIRNAVAAKVGEPGYTGDTYCLGCGQMISSGSSIPALTAAHTHSYASTWSQDGAHHWRACSCGEKVDYAEHTFKDGVCTVCGAADPNYKAPQDHIHSWNGKWAASATEHWHACSGCGETADRGEHIVVTEGNIQKCEVCGMTLGEIREQEKEEQKSAMKQAYVKQAAKEFNDVKEKDWFSGAVGWAVQNSVTNGTSAQDKVFSPDAACTQEQILTMLYRAERVAADPSFQADFSDMAAARAWAAEKGIISAGFDPNKYCTRATAVYYMWKAADSPKAADSVSFVDVAAGSDYEQAVAWAVANGVTNGTSTQDRIFSPDAVCNRGQIVTFLYREAVEPLM